MARLTLIVALLASLCLASRALRADDQAPLRLVAPGSGTVRALVIGIDHYSKVTRLRGAVADARDLSNALRTMGSTDVTTLLDQDADRTRVLKELDGLVARTQRGDLIIITLAGHGAKEDERVKGSSSNGSDEVFLLVGFDAASGAGGTEKILNHEFHHYIKLLEDGGAQVLFVADTCYGGGLARAIAPGSPEVSYRQAPRYRLVEDDLKPVSTPAEAFLSELDFDHTTFLAAVDSETKAPEVLIDGAYRGALSYSVARAIEGAADEKHDGSITLREFFAYTRKVVYQLSDERQSIVAVESPHRDLDRDVVLQLRTRGLPDAPPTQSGAHAQSPSVAKSPPTPPRPIRLASMTSRAGVFAQLHPLLTPVEIVDSDAAPDVTWDPVAREAIAGNDKVAIGVDLEDLPGVIDRTAAVRDIKDLVVKSPQSVHVLPDASLHSRGSRISVDVTDATGRNLILVDVTGAGVVQMLYPVKKSSALTSADYSLPFVVRDPFGADEVLAITSLLPMDDLVEALHELDNRRTAGRLIDVMSRFVPPDARIGLVGLFTVP